MAGRMRQCCNLAVRKQKRDPLLTAPKRPPRLHVLPTKPENILLEPGARRYICVYLWIRSVPLTTWGHVCVCPCTLNPNPQTLDPQLETLNPKSKTLSPQPETLNPKSQTLKEGNSVFGPIVTEGIDGISIGGGARRKASGMQEGTPAQNGEPGPGPVGIWAPWAPKDARL